MRKEWDVKTLENVCKMYQPKTVAKKNLISNGKYPVFGANGIIGRYNKYNHENPELLVTCRGATCGAVNISEPFSWINGNAMVIKPGEHLLKSYVAYFFRGAININDVITGSAQPQITRTSLNSVKIPIPPLPEQKRIVAILDEAFEAIDQAKANIERNIENAEELFQSKLNEIFSQRGDGWEERTVDEITNVINGYAFKSNNFSPENSVKSIKITNVGVQEFVEDTENNLPKDFLDTYDKVKVSRGDIVIALTRTIISSGLKVARVPESYDGALVNQRVAALTPIKELINPTYLYYFLSTDIVSNYVLSNVNTLMQPNLSIRDLRKLQVPICSISKQKEITFIIDSLWDSVNKVIETYQRELNNISELKKTILQKAFSGELTANEHVAA